MTKELKKTGAQHNEKEIEKIIKERDEYLAGWQRAQADYQNAQKEIERARTEFMRYAREQMIEELFPVVDSFEEALKHIPQEKYNEAWVMGVLHIKKQFDEMMKKQGIEAFGLVGDEFDPALHDALQQVHDEGAVAGKVVTVVRSGYRTHDRILRHAQVVVGM